MAAKAIFGYCFIIAVVPCGDTLLTYKAHLLKVIAFIIISALLLTFADGGTGMVQRLV